MRTASRARWRSIWGAFALCGLLLGLRVDTAAETPEAVLYRIFLSDGSSIVSYGEYSRVGDQVVFSMPLGAEIAVPRLQLVSIPSTTVNWMLTERYADSARAAHYAGTRGESDFTLLSSEVAYALNEVALIDDPERQLDLAQAARRRLQAWPQDHYGYRAGDVQQIVGLLDGVISEIRVAAGQQRFDLDFVALTTPPVPMALMSPPSLQETIAQALGVARLSAVPAERMSLLRATGSLIAESASRLASGWAETMAATVATELEAEEAVERAYQRLAATIVEQSDEQVATADVLGLERLRRFVTSEDARLGGRRPNQLRALLSTVDTGLASARRLRLAQDRWNLRIQAYRQYQRTLRAPVATFVRSRAGVEAIRSLAGPDADVLVRLGEQLAGVEAALAASTPPVDLQSVHDLMTRAVQLARTSVTFRQDAVQSGNMDTAWDASAAASGALMLFAQAQTDLERQLRAPELR